MAALAAVDDGEDRRAFTVIADFGVVDEALNEQMSNKIKLKHLSATYYGFMSGRQEKINGGKIAPH